VHALGTITAAGFLLCSIILLPSLTGLCLYHMSLIASNETTRERIKANSGFCNSGSKYSRGCVGNIADALCGATRASDLRARVRDITGNGGPFVARLTSPNALAV
jgi:hypothetical protein